MRFPNVRMDHHDLYVDDRLVARNVSTYVFDTEKGLVADGKIVWRPEPEPARPTLWQRIFGRREKTDG